MTSLQSPGSPIHGCSLFILSNVKSKRTGYSPRVPSTLQKSRTVVCTSVRVRNVRRGRGTLSKEKPASARVYDTNARSPAREIGAACGFASGKNSTVSSYCVDSNGPKEYDRQLLRLAHPTDNYPYHWSFYTVYWTCILGSCENTHLQTFDFNLYVT